MTENAFDDSRTTVGRLSTAIRVVHCIDSMSVSGGTELNAFRTASALRRRGHEVSLFTLTADLGGMSSAYHTAGVPIERFPVDSLLGTAALSQIRRMAASLRSSRAQVAHAHDLYSNFLLAFAARLAGVPFIASRRWTQYAHRRHFWTDTLAYRSAARVLANSRSVGQNVCEQQYIRCEKVVVIPNFVDADVFDAQMHREQWRREFRFSESDFVLAMVAQLREEKNHQLVLKVFASLVQTNPHLKLLIVGDGELRDRIREQISALGMEEHVVMAGYVRQAWRTVAAADVALLPSLHEGFPNSLIEAMAVGVPIIASKVGGIPDVVQHGVNGTLVPAGDEAALILTIQAAISHYAASRELAVRAKMDVATSFGEDSVIDNLEALYSSLGAGRAVVGEGR